MAWTPDFDAALLGALFTQAPVGLHVLDPDLRIVRFNSAAPGARGIDMGEAVGRTLGELGFAADGVERMLRAVLETGEPVTDFRYRGRLPRAGGDEARVMSVSAFRLQDAGGRTLGVAATVVDITERDRAQRRLELLYRAGERVGSSLDVFRTAQELADVAVSGLADAAAVDVLDTVLHGEAPRRGPLFDPVTVRRAGHQVAEETGLRRAYEIGDVWVMPLGTPYAQALSDLRPRLVSALRAGDPWLIRYPALAETAREAGIHSLMAVPLAARGVVLGMAGFYRTGGSAPFDDADLALATDLVARAAVCVDNARRYTREHTLARLTQRTMVPARLPSHTAAQTAYAFLPVGASGVWYDVIPLSGARIALVAGDVSGHGIRTVTTMGRLRTAVSAFAAMDLQADELLERLHDLTGQLAHEGPPAKDEDADQEELTATCLYVIYDPVTRSCTLSRAGHPAPVLALPDGSVQVIDGPAGPRLGRGVSLYRSTHVDLPEGSILALHNAVVQNTAQDTLATFKDVFGTPRDSLQDMCDALMGSLLPDQPADDALVLLARTRALGPAQLSSWTLPGEPESAAAARRLVADRLTDWNLTDLGFSTELIASELVTNAVRYSTGPLELRLINAHALICEVSDTSHAAPHLRHAEDDDEGGRGLYLVAQLTQHWGTRRTGRGKTIWTEQALPNAPRP
ncbi:SpoIIE family protein phosphatase [Streptomyces sp. NPDC056352]|uniref:ATP-binding SpoIIE family protein phosphatase n=1 Tax=Streptomyces sp. NPDC056352 TaxID=3345791 RepID=UPI0035D9FE9B